MRRGTLRRPPKPAPTSYVQHDKQGRTSTVREAAIYEYFINYTCLHIGHTPTLRDIKEALGISSISVVTYHLHNLLEIGKLAYLDGLLVIPGSKFIYEDAGEQGDRTISAPGCTTYAGDGGDTLQHSS